MKKILVLIMFLIPLSVFALGKVSLEQSSCDYTIKRIAHSSCANGYTEVSSTCFNCIVKSNFPVEPDANCDYKNTNVMLTDTDPLTESNNILLLGYDASVESNKILLSDSDTPTEPGDVECESLIGDGEFAQLLKSAFNIIRILGIGFVLVLSSLDFFKGIFSEGQEAVKKAGTDAVRRLIYCIVIFFLPILIDLLLLLIDGLGNVCI